MFFLNILIIKSQHFNFLSLPQTHKQNDNIHLYSQDNKIKTDLIIVS